MSDYEDMDEEMRRILDEGSASAAPRELEELRAQLAQEPDRSGDFPAGTKVVIEPGVSAPPTRRVVTGVPAALTEKVVQVPGARDAGDTTTMAVDDLELAAAKVENRKARQREAFERGTRQLIGGLTRTQALPSQPVTVDAVKDLYARRNQKSQDTLRSQEAANNAARTKAYLDTTAAAGPRAERGLDLKEAELELRGQMAERKADETAEQFEERKRHNRASEGIGWTSAKRADAKSERDDTRLALKTDALKPRGGWEPIEAGAPTFRDAAQAKAFDASVAAMGAIRNHKEHVLHGLEELKKARTPAEADEVLAKINAQMGALASKLRDAEGLNNTDASNHAVDTMLSLTNGSIVNLKNIANQGRLPAILNAAINSGEANLETMAESNNLRRAKSGGGQTAPRKTATLADGSKVQLSADGKSWEPIK